MPNEKPPGIIDLWCNRPESIECKSCKNTIPYNTWNIHVGDTLIFQDGSRNVVTNYTFKLTVGGFEAKVTSTPEKERGFDNSPK